MERLECVGLNCAARNQCLALTQYGVDTQIETGTCQVPDMITAKKSTFSKATTEFNPAMLEGQEITPLVTKLGESAINQLEQQAPPERLTIIEQMEASLDTRMTLWKTMLEAPKQGRIFTQEERIYHEEIIQQEAKRLDRLRSNEKEFLFARAAFDRRCLDKYNIFFDEQITTVIDRMVGNIMDGEATLLVGDKGISKTAVAKFVSRLSYDAEPLLIAGNGDMDISALIGGMGMKDNTTYLKEAQLLQAIREGRPLILDEMDVPDQSVMMRLQDILLNIKPGHEMRVQENGIEPLIVQAGFAVIATSNEASRRYKNRNVVDPANRDRYDVIRLHYPDLDGSKGDDILARDYKNNRRLVYAAVSDHNGYITGITGNQVEEVAVLAAATQALYVEPPTVTNIDKVGASSVEAIDKLPLLTDCITPRKLYKELSRLPNKNKTGVNYNSVLEQLISRMDQGDQRTTSARTRNLLSEIRKKV